MPLCFLESLGILCSAMYDAVPDLCVTLSLGISIALCVLRDEENGMCLGQCVRVSLLCLSAFSAPLDICPELLGYH